MNVIPHVIQYDKDVSIAIQLIAIHILYVIHIY